MGFGMKNWSDWAETFTRGDHDPSPELFFFVLKNLFSFRFYRANTGKFPRNLVSNYEKPYNLWRGGANWKQKKQFWGRVMVTSGKVSAQLDQFFIPKSLSRWETFLPKKGVKGSEKKNRSNMCGLIFRALSMVKFSAQSGLPFSSSGKVKKEGGGTLKCFIIGAESADKIK